jgi:hypothetical protein
MLVATELLVVVGMVVVDAAITVVDVAVVDVAVVDVAVVDVTVVDVDPPPPHATRVDNETTSTATGQREGRSSILSAYSFDSVTAIT